MFTWSSGPLARVGKLRFGELADYVYCTYCAALLLERMDRDRLEASLTVVSFGILFSF